jgi:hypothetical protein
MRPTHTPHRLAAFCLLSGIAAAQSTWINPIPTPRPAQRCCPGLATDLGRGLVWLFSGGTATAPYPNDTWSWNGVSWTQHSPANAPSGRYGHGMAYDEQRQRVVVFGGSTGGGETWEWDGTSWTQRMPANSPSARYEHAMAYDRLRGRTVLFGGSVGAAETWEWDGTNWTQRTPVTSPSGRRGHSMAFLTATARVVLFGGTAGGDETWEWDGNNWFQRAPAVKPPSRYYFSMCEDLPRARCVIFSGRPNYTLDTWEWDGNEWTQRQPAVQPSARSATGMAYDPVTASPLLFGGLNATRFDETWLFRATLAGVSPLGSGCPGSAGVPVLDSVGRPWLGATWTVRIGNAKPGTPTALGIGSSSTSWSGLPLPLALASAGMPGCTLYVSIDVTIGATATGGTATLPLALPNNPALAGGSVYLQGFVLDPGVNFTGVVLTNAAAALLAAL